MTGNIVIPGVDFSSTQSTSIIVEKDIGPASAASLFYELVDGEKMIIAMYGYIPSGNGWYSWEYATSQAVYFGNTISNYDDYSYRLTKSGDVFYRDGTSVRNTGFYLAYVE